MKISLFLSPIVIRGVVIVDGGCKMTRNDYMDLINVELPNVYDIVTMNVVCPSMVDVVVYVGRELFVNGICDSPLANETRKQLTSLNVDGILSFNK
jgi:hypothetical protein